MSKYFLVPDIHGELDICAGLLRQEGILNDQWERIDNDTFTVQMGDFLNCVVSSLVNDNRCLDHSEWFDFLLVGNHEHPYFGGPAFSGFFKDPVMVHRLRLLDSMERYKVAVDCDGILVTHAGVTTDLFDALQQEGVKASKIADALNGLWKMDKTAHPFSSISWNRGGPYKTGGILWADWKEYKTPKLTQIVGHSVGPEVRLQYKGSQREVTLKGVNRAEWNLWEAICIDLGAGKHSDRIIGAWIKDGDVTLVEYIQKGERKVNVNN